MIIRTMLSIALSIATLVAPVSALAQDVALAQDNASPETALERWEADPTTVFDASEIDIDDFLWIARPVVVFGDAPQQPTFVEQIELLTKEADALARRDVVVVVDADPAARSELRLRLRPRGFQLAVIEKDGEVALRKPSPWDVRELTRSIDKMPMRRREIREGGS